MEFIFTLRRLIGMSLLTVLVLMGYAGESSASGLTELSAVTLAVGKGGEGTTSFVLSGDSPRLIVIRGLGPSVTDSGKRRGHQPMIRDPRLVLLSGGGRRSPRTMIGGTTRMSLRFLTHYSLPTTRKRHWR